MIGQGQRRPQPRRTHVTVLRLKKQTGRARSRGSIPIHIVPALGRPRPDELDPTSTTSTLLTTFLPGGEGFLAPPLQFIHPFTSFVPSNEMDKRDGRNSRATTKDARQRKNHGEPGLYRSRTRGPDAFGTSPG